MKDRRNGATGNVGFLVLLRKVLDSELLKNPDSASESNGALTLDHAVTHRSHSRDTLLCGTIRSKQISIHIRSIATFSQCCFQHKLFHVIIQFHC